MIQIDDLTLYDLTEAAGVLGISRTRLANAATRGEVVAVAHGGRLMLAAEEVEFLRAHPIERRHRARPAAYRPPRRPDGRPISPVPSN